MKEENDADLVRLKELRKNFSTIEDKAEDKVPKKEKISKSQFKSELIGR